MRRNRIILAILWILSLVGISFFGGPVSFGFFALFTFAPLVSLLYLILVYFFFHIYQELDSKRLVANHVMPFKFILINEYHFGFVSVRVRFYSSYSSIIGLSDDIEYEFLPGTGITRSTGLNCKYRGEYEVGIKKVELQDYFRLFRLSYKNREPRRVIVKPDTVKLTALGGVDLSLVAREVEGRSDRKDVLVRDYEPGDDPRYINWKMTARNGRLMTHRFIGEEQDGVGILLGTHRCSRDPGVFLPIENKMLETAIALTLFFSGKNIPVHAYHLALTLNEIHVYGPEQFDHYYERMASVVFREDASEDVFIREIRTRPEIFRCKTIFMVLRDWTGEVMELARLLHESHCSTVIFLIRDDVPENLPADPIPGTQIRVIPCEADLRQAAGTGEGGAA